MWNRITILHLMSGTLATFFTAILLRKTVMSMMIAFAGDSPTFNFGVRSFAPAFIIVGAIAGYLTYSRFPNRSAFLIFAVPTSLLLMRLATFPASSVFTSGLGEGWKYYFGEARCSASYLLALANTAEQCQSRLLYLGFCISSIAYSVGALGKFLGIFEFSHAK